MTDQSTVYEDVYDTYRGAEHYADQIVGDNPGTHAAVAEVFLGDETDADVRREKGRLRVLWSASRENLDAWIEQRNARAAEEPYLFGEYVIQYETESPKEEV